MFILQGKYLQIANIYFKERIIKWEICPDTRTYFIATIMKACVIAQEYSGQWNRLGSSKNKSTYMRF